MSEDDIRTPGRSLGGRFAEPTDELLHRINRSVDVDRRLWRADLQGSRAHTAMLASVVSAMFPRAHRAKMTVSPSASSRSPCRTGAPRRSCRRPRARAR